MRPAWLCAMMGAAVFAACFVDRPTEQFTCKTTADCSGFPENRQCVSGFCVVPNCPSDCTTCDEELKTCTADCSTGDTCGFVTCPSGWTCTINCNGDNACDNVTCQGGSTC